MTIGQNLPDETNQFYERNSALDFTKGILVLFMVVYHSLNFYGLSPFEYLPFVAPAFILISGHISTRLSYKKYKKTANLYRIRTVIRSLKLIGIFIVLNLIILILIKKGENTQFGGIIAFFDNWVEIFLIGSPQTVAFDVLLPISYTLFLTIFLSHVKRIDILVVTVFAVIVLGVSSYLANTGSPVYTIGLIGAGLLGLSSGFLSLEVLNFFSISWFRLSGLCVVYAIITFGLPYSSITQIVLTVTMTTIIYSIGTKVSPIGKIYDGAVRLGRYSLIGYIVHIGFLKVYIPITRSFFSTLTVSIIVAAFVTSSITYLTILALDKYRAKYSSIDRLYRLVFA